MQIAEGKVLQMKKRIGIVGLGDIAQKAYLPLLTAREDIEIVGIMSRTAETVERIGSKYRIEGRYTKLEALLDQELDAVFVHSPTETHRPIVEACLLSGAHVYVDKPISYEIEDSVYLMELANQSGKTLGVGFNRRFAPHYRDAKQWMAQTGGLHIAVVQKNRTKPQKYAARHTLYDDVIHIVDLLVWLGAVELEMLSRSLKVDHSGRLVYTSGNVRLPQGVGIFFMDRYAGADQEKLELHGGGRTVEVHNMDISYYSSKEEGERVKRFGGWTDTLERRGFTGIIDHFLNTMNEPHKCEIKADTVMLSHLLIEQMLHA